MNRINRELMRKKEHQIARKMIMHGHIRDTHTGYTRYNMKFIADKSRIKILKFKILKRCITIFFWSSCLEELPEPITSIKHGQFLKESISHVRRQYN